MKCIAKVLSTIALMSVSVVSFATPNLIATNHTQSALGYNLSVDYHTANGKKQHVTLSPEQSTGAPVFTQEESVAIDNITVTENGMFVTAVDTCSYIQRGKLFDRVSIELQAMITENGPKPFMICSAS